MQARSELKDLVAPIKCIKAQVLDYLMDDHQEVISRACLGEFPDDLVCDQVEEEVNSLLKIINRFKESLAVTYSELQYGEPVMGKDTNDHADKVKEDSKHWEGVERELHDDKE